MLLILYVLFVIFMHFCTVPVVMFCDKGEVKYFICPVLFPFSCIDCEIWVAYVTLDLVCCNWTEDCAISSFF